jgi:hypothetical protein
MITTLRVCENCEVAVANWKCLDCEQECTVTDSTEAGAETRKTDKKITAFGSSDCFCWFCCECKDLHLKMKQFKTHRFEDFIQKFYDPSKNGGNSRKCCNCEESLCKFVCLNCLKEEKEDDCYLCLGCSILHPKIKSFRNHNVVIINNNKGEMTSQTLRRNSSSAHENRFLHEYDVIEQTNENLSFSSMLSAVLRLFQGISDYLLTGSLPVNQPNPPNSNNSSILSLLSISSLSNAIIQFQLYLLYLMEDISTPRFSSFLYWKSVLIFLSIILCYFAFVKRIFGKNSISIHLLLLLSIVFSNYYSQQQSKQQEKVIFQESISNNHEIFQNGKSGMKESHFLNGKGGVGRGGIRSSLTGVTANQLMKEYEKEFPDEFTYEKRSRETEQSGEKKGIQFKSRTRAYIPGKKHSAGLEER